MVSTSESFPIDRFIARDTEVWENFARTYTPLIHSVVRRTLNTGGKSADPAQVEDIVQEVFLRLVQDDCRLLKTYDPGRARFLTWLTWVAKSTAIDFLRRPRLSTVPLEEARDIAGPPTWKPPGIEIPDGVLSPREAMTLHLLFERGLSPEEAASEMGVSRESVHSYKYRAIKRLEYFYEDQKPS